MVIIFLPYEFEFWVLTERNVLLLPTVLIQKSKDLFLVLYLVVQKRWRNKESEDEGKQIRIPEDSFFHSFNTARDQWRSDEKRKWSYLFLLLQWPDFYSFVARFLVKNSDEPGNKFTLLQKIPRLVLCEPRSEDDFNERIKNM